MINSFINAITKDRPLPLKELDQVYMKTKSMIETCRNLSEYTKEKDVGLIGDDDLMGLSFLKFCSSLRIIILEKDKRILNHIIRVSEELDLLDLPLELKEYDVLNELPPSLLGSIDFFYTNPPYGSKNGGDSCKAFILRGIELCKIKGYGAFALPSKQQNDWAKKVEGEVLKFITQSGCKLIRCWCELQRYQDNPIRSSLYLIQKLEDVPLDKDFLKGIDLY